MTRVFALLRRTARSAAVAFSAGAVLLLAAPDAGAQARVDESLPKYQKTGGVSGTIKSVGSDTLNNLMTLWAEEFKKAYPNVNIEIEGKGSSTAPPALIEGTAQLGPMSRAMKGSEVDAFARKYGYKPTEIRTAVDALAVFVHKDNPIKSLTMDQLRHIFSVEGSQNMSWGQLGVTDPAWSDKPVSLYGRNSASGTYGFFKEVALGNADYKASVKEQPGSSSVVQGVASDRYAIGYSGIGYATADVRAVPIEGVEATAENAYAGDYPLARFLYVYVNVPPSEQPTPVVREFIRLILSQEGQQAVVKDGYFPVPAAIAEQDLAKLNAN